jgi:hypothetical protein
MLTYAEALLKSVDIERVTSLVAEKEKEKEKRMLTYADVC